MRISQETKEAILNLAPDTTDFEAVYWDLYPIEDLKRVFVLGYYTVGTDGSRIYLTKHIGPADADVYLGIYFSPSEIDKLPLGYKPNMKNIERKYLRVVKWIDGVVDKEDIRETVKLWKVIPQVMRVDTHVIWDRHVLVMPFLEEYDMSAWRKIAIDILSNLELLHSHLEIIHNDVKPGNIMLNPETGKYILIDLDNVASKRKLFGYERRAWSPMWTSQIVDYGQVTNPKYDLLELAYTLNYLVKPSAVEFDSIREIVDDGNNPIYHFVEYVRNLDERTRILDHSVYDELRSFF